MQSRQFLDACGTQNFPNQMMFVYFFGQNVISDKAALENNI